MAIATTNPATGEILKAFDEISDEELDARLSAAKAAFQTQQRRPPSQQRAAWMNRAAELLDAEQEDVARLMTTEMGKTIESARAEVAKCARGCRYYAEHAEALLADEPADPAAVGATAAYARYQPLGVVLAVMPWNFPLWQVIALCRTGADGRQRRAAQARLERPPDGAVPRRALRARRLPGGQLPDPADRLVPSRAGHPRPAGCRRDPDRLRPGGRGRRRRGRRDDQTERARARRERRVHRHAERRPRKQRPRWRRPPACQNNGQSCIAAKRFIVHESSPTSSSGASSRRCPRSTVGDPLEESTDVGPLATSSGRDDVEELVADAVAKGAKVLCGGERLSGPGWYYPPTVITELTPEMRMYGEEVFGPVATLFRVGSIDEAVELANATDFGLGANAWTNDEAERERFVRDLEAGAVFVNGMVTSYPELPFGGIKTSGYGRELSATGNPGVLQPEDRLGRAPLALALRRSLAEDLADLPEILNDSLKILSVWPGTES